MCPKQDLYTLSLIIKSVCEYLTDFQCCKNFLLFLHITIRPVDPGYKTGVISD